MTTINPAFAIATDILIKAAQGALMRLNGNSVADVEEAMSTYRQALDAALAAKGGPYPVAGMRGWTWLDGAPGDGARLPDGQIHCQSRALSPEGVPHRCVLGAAHRDRNHWWPQSGAEATP